MDSERKAPEFKRIRPHKVHAEAMEQIQSLIRGGQLQPGDRLPPERELAEHFGISRASVREALSALEALGVIVINAGAGTFVSEAPSPIFSTLFESRENPLEILETRLILEGGIARLAAERRTEADLLQMRALIEQTSQEIRLGQPPRRGDFRFHLAVAAAAHNRFLYDSIRSLGERMESELWQRLRQRRLDIAGLPERYFAQHVAVLEAIERGSPDKAARAMELHLQTVIDDLLGGRS